MFVLVLITTGAAVTQAFAFIHHDHDASAGIHLFSGDMQASPNYDVPELAALPWVTTLSTPQLARLDRTIETLRIGRNVLMNAGTATAEVERRWARDNDSARKVFIASLSSAQRGQFIAMLESRTRSIARRTPVAKPRPVFFSKGQTSQLAKDGERRVQL